MSQDGDLDTAKQDTPNDSKEDIVAASNVVAEDASHRPEVVQSPVHRTLSASALMDHDLVDKGALPVAQEQSVGAPRNDVVKTTKSDAQLHLSPQSHDAGSETKLSDEEQSHSESVASLPLEGQSEEESLAYSVQEAQESGHSDPPPGAMKSQDSSHDVQTTTSAAPTKKRSSKSRENVRGAKGTIRLTQVGVEEVKNVAQCSLVTSTGKVVTFKFSLDYDKPSELCRHLVRKGNGLLLHCIFRYQFTFCNSNFLFTFVCVCLSLSLYLPLHPFFLYPQTKHGYLQSNEEEEFLQQVADVLQKTKLEKKKPSPKLQAQDTKPAPPSELDPPETKVVGSSKPSDISGHQEVKPKAAETKGGDAANHPPIAEQKVLKDESTATSPHVTLDDPISHAPKERFISQTSIDSVSSV